MQLLIDTGESVYRLTTDHSASSYGVPVLVGEDGEAYGVCDYLPSGETAGELVDTAMALIERFFATRPGGAA
jgi:hypothetical protein